MAVDGGGVCAGSGNGEARGSGTISSLQKCAQEHDASWIGEHHLQSRTTQEGATRAPRPRAHGNSSGATGRCNGECWCVGDALGCGGGKGV